MASNDQLKALIKSHAEGDDSRFYAVALQMAAFAARGGKAKLAQELRELIDEVKAKASQQAPTSRRPVPLAQPRGELAGILMAEYPSTRLSEVVLEESLALRLNRVVLEQRQRERIRQHGLSPLRKLLLAGPPGTGKTMTARALAGELGLPLFTVQLDGLITKYLGETSAKLRLVFDAIRSTRGVYLFDEFDALGTDRGTPNEVGEIRRVLSSFLQFVEVDDSDALVIAATNNVGLLDQALFRRFDLVLEFSLPSDELALVVMKNRLAIIGADDVDWASLLPHARGLSAADIVRACDQATKDAILEGGRALETADVVRALADRQAGHQAGRPSPKTRRSK